MTYYVLLRLACSQACNASGIARLTKYTGGLKVWGLGGWPGSNLEMLSLNSVAAGILVSRWQRAPRSLACCFRVVSNVRGLPSAHSPSSVRSAPDRARCALRARSGHHGGLKPRPVGEPCHALDGRSRLSQRDRIAAGRALLELQTNPQIFGQNLVKQRLVAFARQALLSDAPTGYRSCRA
jgi:hypothetical protein